MPVIIIVLATAVFAQATSEFMLAGLLPDIATDLGVSIPTAGLLTSAFAVGMIVGAPTMAVLGRRWSPRATLTAFLVAFTAAHVVGAFTSDFGVLLTTRVVAAVSNAGFLAVTLSAVSALVAPALRTRALAIILAGTTLALIAGVPGGAALGAALGWRSTLWAVALMSMPAIVAVAIWTPRRPGADDTATPTGSLREELAILRHPTLAATLVLGMLVNGATFCAFTYLSPLVGDLDGGAVPALLAAFGLGSFVGVAAAGRIADTCPARLIGVGGVLLCGGWLVLAATAGHPLALFAMAPVQGLLSFLVGSTLIARIMHHSSKAPTLSGSFATVALNVGAAVGPIIGGLAFRATDETGPLLASATLVAAALALVGARRIFRSGATDLI